METNANDNHQAIEPQSTPEQACTEHCHEEIAKLLARERQDWALTRHAIGQMVRGCGEGGIERLQYAGGLLPNDLRDCVNLAEAWTSEDFRALVEYRDESDDPLFRPHHLLALARPSRAGVTLSPGQRCTIVNEAVAARSAGWVERRVGEGLDVNTKARRAWCRRSAKR